MTAFMPEPHILLMVVAADETAKARADGSLARRSLAQARGQHATEEDFVDGVGRNACARDGGTDGDSAELRCGEIFEVALECADGRARGARR